MEIFFYLQEGEKPVTPIRAADALISCEIFTRRELQEIAAHLDVYCKTCVENEIAKAYSIAESQLAELGGKA